MRLLALIAGLLFATTAAAQPQTPQAQAQMQARIGVQLLDRTQIVGNEAEAMMAVRRMLTAIAEGHLNVVPNVPTRPEPPPKEGQ